MKDEKMTDDALSSLKSLRAAQPSTEAKKLALNAAMVAFDAAQAKTKVSDEAGFFTRLGRRMRTGWIAAPAGAAGTSDAALKRAKITPPVRVKRSGVTREYV